MQNWGQEQKNKTSSTTVLLALVILHLLLLLLFFLSPRPPPHHHHHQHQHQHHHTSFGHGIEESQTAGVRIHQHPLQRQTNKQNGKLKEQVRNKMTESQRKWGMNQTNERRQVRRCRSQDSLTENEKTVAVLLAAIASGVFPMNSCDIFFPSFRLSRTHTMLFFAQSSLVSASKTSP